MRKKLILYDLDGTLVDTGRDIAQAMNHLLRQLKRPPLAPREIIRAVGIGVRELASRCLKTDDPKTLDKAVAIYRAYYAEHLLDKSSPYPGVLEALEFFKERKQVVLTNKPNPYSRQILEGLGLSSYFAQIIAGDAEYPRKPDPTAILSLMKKWDARAKETLFIGDGPVDVEAGRNAGVDTVIVDHGFSDEKELAASGPALVVENFKALIALARKQGW
jgi:phosphoglycolate phosphatase